jgi:DNA-3-methyladenine glycosylase I
LRDAANPESAGGVRAVSGTRCWGDGDPLFERYHDEEWGFPVLHERGLFERLALETFQSGLSLAAAFWAASFTAAVSSR